MTDTLSVDAAVGLLNDAPEQTETEAVETAETVEIAEAEEAEQEIEAQPEADDDPSQAG